MKVLFLSQIVPYPPHGGVLQRGYNIIREIARNHEIHLLAFVHPEILTSQSLIDQSRQELQKFCRTIDYFPLWPKKSLVHKLAALVLGGVYPGPFSELAHRSTSFRNRMCELLGEQEIDLVHYDTIGLARYKNFAPNTPSVITHHNVESNLMARRSEVERSAPARWYVARQARLLRESESTESARFDCNVMMSATDEADLKAMAPEVHTAIVPNGVDTEYFQPSHVEVEPAIIYTGGMNMFANEDAVLYMLKEMWMRIKQAIPNVHFYVIGQDPTKEILEYAKKDDAVTVTGFVEDIRPYVARSAVYVVPIRVGGGTRLKVLDALAQGKAIVSTSVGCEGINVTNGGDIRIEDNPVEFADRTIELLKDSDMRLALGQKARQLAVEEYSWEKIGKVLDGVYQDVGRKAG